MGSGEKGQFSLDYERLTVVLTMSFPPRISQKEIIKKSNSYELKQDDLREWCDGQSVWEKGMAEYDFKSINKVSSPAQVTKA